MTVEHDITSFDTASFRDSLRSTGRLQEWAPKRTQLEMMTAKLRENGTISDRTDTEPCGGPSVYSVHA
jgi:hypothetical protein